MRKAERGRVVLLMEMMHYERNGNKWRFWEEEEVSHGWYEGGVHRIS